MKDSGVSWLGEVSKHWYVAMRGRGKWGGARVIYYFHSAAVPVFLFAVYAKAAKKDLMEAQRSELRNIVASIPKSYRIKP